MMRNREPSEDYFYWLCAKVGLHQNMSPKMVNLARDLHAIPFTWCVPNDDNRAADGEHLREAYFQEGGLDFCPASVAASVFEMLVALAIRADEILEDLESSGNEVSVWFMNMIKNLHLVGYDDMTNSPIEIEEIRRRNLDNINQFLTRKYSRNGRGGLFPLNHPTSDQTRTEIWYQMMAYLNEKYPKYR